MKKLTIATAVIKQEGKYLIARRLEPEWLKGLWEFPGGTVEQHETIEQTLVREMVEEVNLNVKLVKEVHRIVEVVKDREITIVFNDTIIEGDVNIKLDEHDKYAWIDENDWDQYKWTGLTGQYAEILFNKK